MPDLWLNRSWYRRGILYHLYLVVLKDNYYRARRAGRWTRVNLKIALRWVVRYLTGRRWTVPLPDPKTVMRARITERFHALSHEFFRSLDTNRSLLTGMTVALQAGHGLYQTGWERYKNAARPRSYYSRAVAVRIVGKPVVYQDRLKNKLGVTEWNQEFTPRSEQLAARKRLKGAQI